MAQQNQQQNLDHILLQPNPPVANEPATPPHLPDTKSFTIKVLDNPHTRPFVMPEEIYFFAPKTIHVAVCFEKTKKTFSARVSNMKVRDWHILLVPENPREAKKPLMLEWFRDGVMERRALVEGNDLWDEIDLGLGGDKIENGVWKQVFVMDA